MPTNAEIVKATLDAFGRGDIRAVLDHCSEDVEAILAGDPSVIPFAGRWTGKSRVAEYYRIIGETVDVLRWEPRHIIASGKRVAAFYVMDARIKATGKTVADSRIALDYTVHEGRLTGCRVYIDTAAVEKAFLASKAAT